MGHKSPPKKLEVTIPETNSSPLKIDHWKSRFLLETTIFRCENVSFREVKYCCLHWKNTCRELSQFVHSATDLAWGVLAVLPQDGFGKIIPADDAWPRVKYLKWSLIFDKKQPALPSSPALRQFQVGSKRNLMNVTWMCSSLFFIYRVIPNMLFQGSLSIAPTFEYIIKLALQPFWLKIHIKLYLTRQV